VVGREAARPPVFAVGVVTLAGRGGPAAGAGGAEVVAVEPAYAGPLAHAQGVAAQAVVAHRHAVLHFLPGPDVVGGGGDVVATHLGHGGALDPLARFVTTYPKHKTIHSAIQPGKMTIDGRFRWQVS